MAYYVVKTLITTVLIVVISELSKRSTVIGAMLWLYADTNSTDQVAALGVFIFWLVLPSLALFVALPILLKQGVNFYLSMGLSIGITVMCYGLMLSVLGHFGIKL